MTPVALACIGILATKDQMSATTTAVEIAHSAHHPWDLVVSIISSRASGLEALGVAGGCGVGEVWVLMKTPQPQSR